MTEPQDARFADNFTDLLKVETFTYAPGGARVPAGVAVPGAGLLL
jgi:hypothetical protein